MTPKLDELLCRAFPLLYKDRLASMQVTAMCWGFMCADGWYDIIWDLSKKLESMIKRCKKGKYFGRPAASEVKEKFGTLRFYMTTSTEAMEKEIEKATRLSAKICEDCGEPGKCQRVRGWVRTVCDSHKKFYEDKKNY